MRCPRCRTDNPPEARFCLACGQPLGAPPQPPPPAPTPPPPPGAAAEDAAAPAAPLAGIGRRFLALLVDVVLLNLLVLLFFGAQAGASPGLSGGAQIAAVVAAWLYNAGLESSPAQATLGKRLLGVRVTDAAGARISFARASLRFVGKIVSGLVLALGYVVAFFTPKRQALHDLIAGTLVTRRPASSADTAPPAR